MVLKFTDGELPQLALDRNAMVQGIKGDGVYSGFAVSEKAVPDMSVDVAPGTCYVGGTKYTEASTVNVAISAADPTNPRRDIITYDTSAGNPACVTGTPSTNPNPPDIPDGDIVLAIVYVKANATAIYEADITDKRVFVRLNREIETHTEVTTNVHGFADTSKVPTTLEWTTRNGVIRKYINNSGSDIYISSDARNSYSEGSGTTWHKAKSITLTPLFDSTIKIKYTVGCTSIGGVYGQVYSNIKRNGVVVGTQRTLTTVSSQTPIETISGWSEGDTLELWIGLKKGNSTTSGYVEKLQLLGTVVMPIQYDGADN